MLQKYQRVSIWDYGAAREPVSIAHCCRSYGESVDLRVELWWFVGGEEVLYEVSVHTGDVSLAGTDANVFIQLYSSDNQSDKINLSEIRGNYEDPFERNQTDIFQVRLSEGL